MNPVLLVTHNNLELTKRAIASLRDQYVACYSMIVDNGSTDGTQEWIAKGSRRAEVFQDNAGVSLAWNVGLRKLFGNGYDHVLVLNNDVVIPPWYYSELLNYKVPFVTGVSVDKMEDIKQFRSPSGLVPHPDFSAFLIRRSAWEEIGLFDEGMKFYAQDCDYHIRACHEGVPLLAANLPFYHERSSTLKLASPEERADIEAQANADRAFFYKKWGFAVGSEEYQRATQTIAGTPFPYPGEERV